MAWKKLNGEMDEDGIPQYWIINKLVLPSGKILDLNTPHNQGELGWEWTDEIEK